MANKAMIDQMIENLHGSISDIQAVIKDLEVAKEYDDMSEINEAYARQAVSRVNSVIDALSEAA